MKLRTKASELSLAARVVPLSLQELISWTPLESNLYGMGRDEQFMLLQLREQQKEINTPEKQKPLLLASGEANGAMNFLPALRLPGFYVASFARVCCCCCRRVCVPPHKFPEINRNGCVRGSRLRSSAVIVG